MHSISKGRRLTASVETQAIPPEKVLSSDSSAFSLPCSGQYKGQVYLTKESGKLPYIRLYSKACAKKKKLTATTIINRTNNFSTSVFLLKNNGFTSDLIRLSKGQNEIQITKKYKNKKDETFSVFISSSN